MRLRHPRMTSRRQNRRQRRRLTSKRRHDEENENECRVQTSMHNWPNFGQARREKEKRDSKRDQGEKSSPSHSVFHPHPYCPHPVHCFLVNPDWVDRLGSWGQVRQAKGAPPCNVPLVDTSCSRGGTRGCPCCSTAGDVLDTWRQIQQKRVLSAPETTSTLFTTSTACDSESQGQRQSNWKPKGSWLSKASMSLNKTALSKDTENRPLTAR